MNFQVLALDARQQVVSLRLAAANATLAAEQARQQGLTLISLESQGLRLPRRAARFPATLFSMELMSLLEAGLNLVEALQTLAEKEAHGERQEVLSGMLAAIHRGEPFSQAVAGYPQHFSPLYVRPSRPRSAPAACARRSAATSPTRKSSTGCARRSSPPASIPRS
jgi:general secretion pathway protein F